MAILKKYRSVIIYSVALALLLLLLRLLEWQLIFIDNKFEFYAGSIAVIFTILGLWLATQFYKPKTILLEKQIVIDNANFILNQQYADDIGLSKRELEVLSLMATGMSNQEIAGRLFVSVNTIKTHLANLFLKLEVQRRTQAVEKARRMSLIP